MGVFDMFKKKASISLNAQTQQNIQSAPIKTFICARCKKEITDEESKWIGNHRFCNDCAAPTKASTISHHLQEEAKDASYQAYMDCARGSMTPDEAYANRGFIKDKDDKWVYGKLVSKDSTSHNIQKEPQAVIFRMLTKDGQKHNFAYLEHTRYNPNRSSACGYGSDDWMYLCKENNTHYLLMFTDNASFGTAWMCTELLEGDYEKLVKEDVKFWGNVAYSKERTKLYAICLTDIENVRHLLPTSSRCGKLTDESFLR